MNRDTFLVISAIVILVLLAFFLWRAWVDAYPKNKHRASRQDRST